jgi:hypothetical protein
MQASEENKLLTDLSEIETLRGNFKCGLGRKASESSADKNMLREINNNRSNMTEAAIDVQNHFNKIRDLASQIICKKCHKAMSFDHFLHPRHTCREALSPRT